MQQHDAEIASCRLCSGRTKPDNHQLRLEHKDGVSGCCHPWNWVKKRDDEYNEYLRKMGEEMGRMLDEEMKEKENEKNR